MGFIYFFFVFLILVELIWFFFVLNDVFLCFVVKRGILDSGEDE